MKFLKTIKKSYSQKKFDYIFESPGPGNTFVLSKNFFNYLQKRLEGNANSFLYHDWLIYALARHNNFKWIIDDAPNLFYRQHDNNFMGANIKISSYFKRINRILFGDYYSELIQLHKILYYDKKLNFQNVWFFIINFNQTRRKLTFAILNIPFLMILSIQKNDY